MKKIIISILFLLSYQILFAEQKNIKTENKKWGITPVGMPFYTPDTSFGLGAQIIYYNYPDHDSDARPDEIAFYFIYTLLNQVIIGFTDNLYFGKNIKLSGIVEFSRYPRYFWGIGPDTKEKDKEKYLPVSFVIAQSGLFSIIKNLYIGPQFTCFYTKIEETDDNGILTIADIPGSKKARSIGPGIHINWDSTDSIFYPHHGLIIDLRNSFFFVSLGSQFSYTRSKFDIRYFYQIYNDHVLGFQCNFIFTNGQVPLHNLAELGGQIIMRGYLKGRYTDRNSAALQVEYRFPVYWRIGGALFGSIGSVSPALDKFNRKYVRKAGGTGLRVNVDKSQHINIRLDAGINDKKEINFYFLVKEAF